MKNIVSLLIFSIFFTMNCTSSDSDFVIVENRTPQAVIVIGKNANEQEQFAADELQSFIKKSSGVVLPIKRDNEDFSGNIIAVGQNEINLKAKVNCDNIEKEGFRIKTEGNILSLIGKDDRGTQFAVYTFLEKYLGIRWFWPGELGEVVPKNETIKISRINDLEVPDFKWRNRGPDGALWGATTGPTEMHARELVLGITREHQKEVELWEKRNKWGGMKIYGGHALGEIFPPEKYAKTHPEYYAWVDGKRAVPGADYDYKHEGQICTTNQDAINVTVEWVNKILDDSPDYDAVHITMNDGGGFCECERCMALDSGELIKRPGIDAEEMKKRPQKYNVITNRIFTFVNKVSEEVQKTHPGKYVVSMAYSRYITPPKNIQLHPFVIPQYCLWSAYRHANPEQKKLHGDIASGWAEAAERTAVYEYFINGSWPGIHRLVMPYIAESIKYLYRKGIDLYQMQSGDEFGINGLNYYIAGKLLWNTELDEKELLDDFYRMAFGNAGDSVKKFHNRLEEAWKIQTLDGLDVSCNSIKNTRLLDYLSPQLLEECNQDLTDAENAANNDLIRRRIEFYKKGFRYAELTVDGVKATKKLEELGLDVFQLEKSKQKIRELKQKDVKTIIENAVNAWEKRDRFVEELKNDYVLSYFWVKYNDLTRRFNPVENLKELTKIPAVED